MAYSRALPTANADGTAVANPSRTGRYNEAYVLPLSGKELYAADEGSYFSAVTATPGTGVIGHAAPTTFDETKPLIYLFNNNTAASGIRIYPQFLQLHDTVVSVAAVRMQFTVTLDNTNLRTSGGTALTVSNVNMDSGVTSGAASTAFSGAVVCAAATANRRIIANVSMRGTIDVVEDVYEFVFGGLGGGSGVGSRPATVADVSRTLPPVVIGPQQCMKIHQWSGSQSTGPTFEVVLGWIER